MTSDDSLMLYAKLAGFRLAVLANRACCCGDFSRELHDRLVDGLDATIDQVRAILVWYGVAETATAVFRSSAHKPIPSG
ncbi:hypothetical protein [Rhizobium leguminosarum]|uniref:hypothetical protein n=1 Tax=Rhizobium leguminosarum TaxID=384 RepID=UPI001AE3C49B|nr:hypothetical protein [Rhizobium leguminosarum]